MRLPRPVLQQLPRGQQILGHYQFIQRPHHEQNVAQKQIGRVDPNPSLIGEKGEGGYAVAEKDEGVDLQSDVGQGGYVRPTGELQ